MEPVLTAFASLATRRADAVPATPDDLLTLARGRTNDDRKRLLLGIAALCDAAPPSGEASPILSEIFLSLAAQAERDIRRILADRLQHAEWAPPALVNMLALDEIEIARPIIASSPLLRDDDLLAVMERATLEHRIEIARRPLISGRVADALIDRAEPASLTALASNRTCEISSAGLTRLVEHSRRIAALRAPLTRHPRLSPAMAQQLYQWVGEALREAIADRFRVDSPSLAVAIDEAVKVAREEDLRPPLHDNAERDEMDRRLIAKLQSAGQLRPGFLIRALRERRLSLFEHGLASLGDFTLAQVRAAARSPSAEALYHACAAVGIDRAVFPAALAEVRRLNGGLPGDAGETPWKQMGATPAMSTRAFHALIGASERRAD